MKKLTKRERVLLNIINDTLWMAIRYAHGRHTPAPSTVRDAVNKLKEIYPKCELQADITIKSPSTKDLNGGWALRSDWLDDLFEQ